MNVVLEMMFFKSKIRDYLGLLSIAEIQSIVDNKQWNHHADEIMKLHNIEGRWGRTMADYPCDVIDQEILTSKGE